MMDETCQSLATLRDAPENRGVSYTPDRLNVCRSGFELQDAFSSAGGHFGLIGMRERAERLGGDLQLDSHPGGGTKVEVKVMLP